MSNISRISRFKSTNRFWLAAIVSAVALMAVVACAEAPAPTSTPIPATATAVPPTEVPPTATPEPEPLKIVATSNIVGDWVSIVGGDRVDLLSLVPRGADPHTVQVGAGDTARVKDAALVFAVGFNIEDQWLDELIHNASGDPNKVIHLAELVDPIEYQDAHHDEHEGEHEDEHADEHEGDEHQDDEHEDEHHEDEHEGEHHEDEHGHNHGTHDPHFWFDPERVIIAVEEIAEMLGELQPASADYFDTNRDNYIDELKELDEWVFDRVSEIPEDNRILVLSHDAFGYFANRYGFEVAGVIIPGGGTEMVPSAQELAELVHHVEESGATVVFSEVQISDKLAKTLAEESGIRMVGGLHTGSLGVDGGDASTYIKMMHTNTNIIVGALE